MSTKPKLKLKKIKGSSNILHVDSNLVLNSLEDKTVIGKYENDETILLNISDIELCNKWKLPYDSEKVNTNEEDEEQEEVNEEDEEQEEVNEEDDDQEQVNEEDDVQEEAKEENEEQEEAKEENEEQEEAKEEKVNDAQVDNIDRKNSEKELDITDEYINSSTVPSSKHILDMTTQFTKDIHNHFDVLNHFYTDKISTYENNISYMDVDYKNLLTKYNSECEDHNNTKENLKKLQSKFEGIKSLFN